MSTQSQSLALVGTSASLQQISPYLKNITSNTLELPFDLSNLPSNTNSLYITSNSPINWSQTLQEPLKTTQLTTILVENLLSTDSFSLYQFLSQSPNSNAILSAIYPLRLHNEIESLKANITNEIKSGASISFITIDSSEAGTPTNDDSQLLQQGIPLLDILLFLSGQDNVGSIQGFSQGQTDSEHSTISGALNEASLYTIQMRRQVSAKAGLQVQVILNNGKILTVSLTPEGSDNHLYSQGYKQINNYLSSPKGESAAVVPLEYAARLIRLAEGARKSVLGQGLVEYKRVKEGMVPFRTIGSAVFLTNGLFVPCIGNPRVFIDSIYTNRMDKLKEYFTFLVANGEPVNYVDSFKAIYNNPFGDKGVFYIPSLAGKRKDSEMLEALKAGYTVLAEKPAFANADLAKEFAKNVSEEEKRRLFFGWHYLHPPFFRRLLDNVDSGALGKITKIDVNLTVPMVYPNPARMFDPGQGGVGLDSVCYCLHVAMRLAGFKHGVKVLDSKITRGKDIYPELDQLKDLDWAIDTNLVHDNKVNTHLSATFDPSSILTAVVDVSFEDGKVIRITGFNHTHVIIKSKRTPILIKEKDQPWRFYITDEEKALDSYKKTTYDHQIEFIRKHVSGEEKYGIAEDKDGLLLDENIRLQEILDDIFVMGGIPKKVGA